jgi:hypothetical protein
MASDPNFVTTPQKIRVYTLQDDTAFDADPLTGSPLVVSEYDVVWIWFVPVGGFDGVVNPEISPDGGETWFPIQGVESGDLATLVGTITAPDGTNSYIYYMPSWAMFRTRLSGGSAGSVTVKARLTNFNYGNAS